MWMFVDISSNKLQGNGICVACNPTGHSGLVPTDITFVNEWSRNNSMACSAPVLLAVHLQATDASLWTARRGCACTARRDTTRWWKRSFCLLLLSAKVVTVAPSNSGNIAGRFRSVIQRKRCEPDRGVHQSCSYIHSTFACSRWDVTCEGNTYHVTLKVLGGLSNLLVVVLGTTCVALRV